MLACCDFTETLRNARKINANGADNKTYIRRKKVRKTAKADKITSYGVMIGNRWLYWMDERWYETTEVPMRVADTYYEAMKIVKALRAHYVYNAKARRVK